MPERRPAFVHDLGLPLRIKILGNLADDSYDFPLPRFEQWRPLLYKVEQVLLWFGRKRRPLLDLGFRFLRNRSPQVIDLCLKKLFALLLTLSFILGGNRSRAAKSIYAVVHQCVA